MQLFEFGKQKLCLALLEANTEKEVIRILHQHGYWENQEVWLPFGGRDDNYSTIGNQSSSADGALVEKLINSVDAVLMAECWLAGFRPNSPDAPRSISEAVALFFFGDRDRADSLGQVSRWDAMKRRDLSNRITLAATGNKDNPSFTVVDNGEGQTPNSIPHTILSLNKQNKVNVHFVQGKFNMGGTGALRFSGRHNLQLVVSRRNPHIMLEEKYDRSIAQWGFTVVRREDPTGSKRISTYTYLAPELDGVLRFSSDVLPLFPQGNQAYDRETAWGTAIKLYEYQLAGKSHILRKDGLLQRLDLLLPRIGLPARMHECRAYRGHEGSFDTTLTGIGVRLSDDRRENLEPGFPTSGTFAIRGELMTAEVYAFKRGKSDAYKRNEGIIFSVNGQTHGNLPKRFFSRRTVGMNRLEDSILVMVDCSRMSGRSREDLFMNSRDRMERGDFLRSIEKELESTLKDNQLLRTLRQQRRQEDVETKLQDSKPFREVLESILRKSPSLASLFGGTGPLSDPFKSKKARTGDQFSGNQHPSIFKFRDLDYGSELQRTTAVNLRSRIIFETDAVNDYFSRVENAGHHALNGVAQGHPDGPIPDHTLNLQNGVATLNLALPKKVEVGDSFRYELVVQDDTLVEPFLNPFVITVGKFQKQSGGNGFRRPQSDPGNGRGEAREGLAIPTPMLVNEADWEKHGFDRNSALKAIYDPPDDASEVSGYHTYYINMDNVFLKTELKATKEDPEIVKSRWKYGMVLVGMALLRDQERSIDGASHGSEDNNGNTLEDEVARTTAALAPVLLPLIEHLGALSNEDIV